MPPASVQCRNDYGELGYGGPCPPPGSPHRYLVKVYALNVEKLPFGSETPPGKMAKQIETPSIGVAKLMVKFGRKLRSEIPVDSRLPLGHAHLRDESSTV